jgi:type I restriction enzyme S subunit
MKWPQKKLGQVADFLLGKMLDEKKNKGEFRPYLANVNVRWGRFELGSLREMRFELHENERYGLQFGDIVMCEGGEPGRCAIWKNQAPGMMFQKALHRIRPAAELDVGFLYYSFLNRGKNGGFDQYCTGSTIKHLPRQNLAMVEVEVPPLTIQKQIASILSAYDDLIENNTRRIEILEEMARRLYEEWFVQFRFPGHEGVEFKESELGLIPEGWTVKCLGEVADLKWGDTRTTKKSYLEHGYVAYSAAGADGFLSYYDFDRPGIVLSAIGANCGATWFARGKWSCIKNTIRFWSKDDGISEEYLYLATYGSDFWPKRGAAQPFISQEDARSCKLLAPPKALGYDFSELVGPLFKMVDSLSQANKNLRSQRDLLLPKLISGEIDVSDIPMPT